MAVALLALPGPALAGCGGADGPSGAAPGSPSASASAAPTAAPTLSPVELCTKAVVYWTNEMLDAGTDTGLDYQSMGLSDSQYRIVRDLYAKARDGGPDGLVEREAPQRCRDSARATQGASESGSPRGGWPG